MPRRATAATPSLCRILLLLGLAARARPLAVSDNTNLVVPRAAYSSALAAWTLPFPPLAPNAGIVVQACASMRDTHTLCAENVLPPMLSCAALEAELGDPSWVSIARAVRGGDCALDASEAARPVSLSPARFVLPGNLHIQNNATLLAAQAYAFGNNTFTFHLRALLVHSVQSAAVVQQMTWELTLTIPRLTIGALAVENECVHRGLLTPPLAVLVARTLSDDSRPCIWACNPSHIRQPFNKPPLDASAPAPYSPMCFPLPMQYVAFVFEFTIYVEAAASSGLDPAAAFSQGMHDGMDQLADELTASAHDRGLVDALGVVRIHEALYDSGSFPHTLQRHNLFSNIPADLELYHIAASTTANRRLLQAPAAAAYVAVPAGGMLLTGALQHVDATTAFSYAERTVASIGTTNLDPSLRVHSMSTPRFTNIVRSTHMSTPRPLALSLQTQRGIVYAVEGMCFIIILCRCGVLFNKRFRQKNASSKGSTLV
jgi:hypothetical protein